MATKMTPRSITKQRGISINEAAKLANNLGWQPTNVQEAVKYPTDYKLSKAPKDPMKQVLRSYFAIQEEKDDRVMGALDGAVRGDMFRNVEQRWLEWMKLFLSIIPYPEISAARSMGMQASVVPGENLRTGLTMQMIDEFRHSTIQMNLKKWYMENYIDPAGFDITERAFGQCYADTIGRQFGEAFTTGDVLTSTNINLQVIAETAFTNTLFVAMPSEAAMNGDFALPTVFMSVQSDESRHMANGHSVLMGSLKDPDNYDLIERDLRYSMWQNHCIIDAAVGTILEYGTKDRRKERESYAQLWERWIYHDYYRTYLAPLEKYGIEIHHDDINEMWDRIVKKDWHHLTAQFFSVGWPVAHWRIDGMRDEDFEWFEHKYPGWYEKYGNYWNWYNKLSEPGSELITFSEQTGYVYPYRCWSCLVPCLIREDLTVDEVDGELYTYCSEICRWTHAVAFQGEYKGKKTPAMGRFTGHREWEERWDGWDLADCVKQMGFVRDDGKTMIAQPHMNLDPDKMWTLDHIKGYTLGSPLLALRAMSKEDREKAIADYRAGFTINPVS